jgi:hypothetical protein
LAGVGDRRRRTSSVVESIILPSSASDTTPATMPAIVNTMRELAVRDVSIVRLLLLSNKAKRQRRRTAP